MNKIVVTGGSGFIGSHLVSRLIASGCKVLNIDKLPPKDPFYNDYYEYGDLANPHFMFGHDAPKTLIHLAGAPWSMVRGGEWMKDSENAFRNNALATYHAIKEINPDKIIFASTANVYGEGRKLTEDSPINISSGYGYSKWIAEELIRKSGKPYTILRFGTVAGPSGRTFPNRLVWDAIHDIPVELFYNGSAIRDIVDVADICSSLIKAQPLQGTFNVATGEEISGITLAVIIEEEALNRGFKLKWGVTQIGPPGYVKESTLNIDKIKRTGYAPKYNIYDVVQHLFDYYERDGAIEPPSWEVVK